MRAAIALVSLLAAAHAGLAAELTGVVTEAESGDPLPGASVKVTSAGGVEVAKVTTDAEGRYTVRLNVGTFQVRAAAAGYQPRYHKGGRDGGSPVPVQGSEPVRADIGLPRAAELAGNVWRPDGSVLHPGYVWLIRQSTPTEYYNAPIAADAGFRMDDLPPGIYHVRALTYDPVARQLTSPDWDWPEPVTLAVGEPVRLDMRLHGDQAEPNWIALVTDEAGQPLAGVQLMILRVVAQERGAERAEHVSVRRTNAEGRCQLDELPPGRYRVSTTDVPPPYAPWRNPDRRARGADVYARHFQIEEDGQSVTKLTLPRGRTLSVNLRDREGGAMPEDATVSLTLWHQGDQPFGGDGFTARPARASEGTLEVRGLLPEATYELRLQDRDDRARWCVAGVTGARDRRVVVPADGDPPPLEVRLRRCGR